MSQVSHTPMDEIEPSETPKNLTEGERRLLDFIKTFINMNARWPTYREIREAFGWGSSNTVTQKYRQLYSKGWIDRDGVGEWRLVEGTCPYCGQEIKDDDTKNPPPRTDL